MKEDAGDDDNVEDCAKHVGDVGDVGRGEGGDDYVIGDDGVAVIHGVQMVPFYMNVPALRGWEKGGSDKGKKVSRKSHPGEAVVKKEVKKPSASVVGKGSGTGKVPGTKKEVMVPASKKEVLVGAKDLPSLSLGGISLPGGMQLLDNPNVHNFFFALLQVMSQMSPRASQNVSDAPKREEKVNDNGEKEVEAVEEVDAVDLCTSDDEKRRK